MCICFSSELCICYSEFLFYLPSENRERFAVDSGEGFVPVRFGGAGVWPSSMLVSDGNLRTTWDIEIGVDKPFGCDGLN